MATLPSMPPPPPPPPPPVAAAAPRVLTAPIPALPPLVKPAAPVVAPVVAAAPIACLPPDKPMPCKIMGHKEMHCQYKCCKYYADGRRVLVKGCTHGRRNGAFGVPKGLPPPPKP